MCVCVFLKTLKLSFAAAFTSTQSRVVFSPSVSRIPAKLDGWLILGRPLPQIPGFAQTATWPTCDAKPGPTARTPLGRSPTRRTTILGGPKPTRWRRENRGPPQPKQVRLGAQATPGSGFVSTRKVSPSFSLWAVRLVGSATWTHLNYCSAVERTSQCDHAQPNDISLGGS